MPLFELSNYYLRRLDPSQGLKPLDFGRDGLAGSINYDSRFIAVNTFHPEYGYMTLTSVPPFADADRYEQAKVRDYRKSIVHNDGFGLRFDHKIQRYEHYLIEDIIPYIRIIFEDGAIAECITIGRGSLAVQSWRFSEAGLQAAWSGKLWLQRAAYSQLTEGGFAPQPSSRTTIFTQPQSGMTVIENGAINAYAWLNTDAISESDDGLLLNDVTFELKQSLDICIQLSTHAVPDADCDVDDLIQEELSHYISLTKRGSSLVLNRASAYSNLCNVENCLITDHMILPLLWTRDAYYVALSQIDNQPELLDAYVNFVFTKAWRGTYWKSKTYPFPQAWARSYLANGIAKDNRAFQLDQQLFPILGLVEYVKRHEDDVVRARSLRLIDDWLVTMLAFDAGNQLIPTDETPADDDIPMRYHFSSHILLWYVFRQIISLYADELAAYELPEKTRYLQETLIPEAFVTSIGDRLVYAYATDNAGQYYLYHDANDIPLVMMPLWGFCRRDDPIWRNTIDFAFSEGNPGFYNGVLGSVHTPAPWPLGDAQELILAKVLGDRERYHKVWQRVESASQWDGALPEAYDARTCEVVSRHWFAWPNAMIAIADAIPWDWEVEGTYIS